MNQTDSLTRFRRRAFPALFLAIFSAMMGVGIISPLLPLYATSLGAVGIWVGLIFGAFSLSRMVAMPVVGRLSDLHGRKGFILAGLAMYSVFSFAYTLTDNLHIFILIRVLHGLGSAMVVPVAMALIGEMSPPGREGEYMGTITLAMFAGFGAGPLIGGLLHDQWGMAINFYSLTGLSTISFFLVLLLLPRRIGLKLNTISIPLHYGEILKSKLVRGLALYRFVNALGRGAIMCYLPLFAYNKMGLTPAQIGLVLSIFILLISFLQRPFGKLADRFSRPLLIVCGTVASAAMFLLLPSCRSFTELLLVLVPMGVASAISLPAATAMMVGEGKSMGMGSIMALFNLAFSAGLGLGPILGGLVEGRWQISAVFYFASLALVSGIFVFAYYLWRVKMDDPAANPD